MVSPEWPHNRLLEIFPLKAYKVRVIGRVTGVGFRYTVLRAAENLPGLSGYVRNVGYGEVEAVVLGAEPELDAILAVLRKGPPLARVDSCVINETPLNPNMKGFKVK